MTRTVTVRLATLAAVLLALGACGGGGGGGGAAGADPTPAACSGNCANTVFAMPSLLFGDMPPVNAWNAACNG